MQVPMQPSEAPARARSFRGNWNHSDQPDHFVSGNLEILESGTSSLDLNGSLLPRGDLGGDQGIIFGLAHDGTKVTLVHAGLRSQHSPWFADGESVSPPPMETELWESWAVAVGAHLPEGDKTLVKSLALRTPMLSAWATRIGPKFQHATGSRTVGGSAELPEDLTANLGFANLTLRWAARTGHRKIELHPELKVEFSDATPINETWHTTVVPLLQFLTFAVGEGDSVRMLRYSRSGDHDLTISQGADSYGWPFYGGAFEWVTASWMALDRGMSAPFHFEHLISADEAKENFARLLPAWFDLHRVLSGAMLDYFSVQMFGNMTAEESFYRVTRSLEVTHGLLAPGPKIPPADWKSAREAIKVALEGHPYREFILSRTSHVDAPSLKDRLVALFHLCGPRLRNIAPFNVEAFVRKVVDTRDALTHTGDEGPLRGADLHDARAVLELLMMSVLLIQLGYSPEEADENVFRTAKARFIR